MKTRRTETHLTPAALVSHTMIRIQGEQEGDIAVFHACSPMPGCDCNGAES